MGEPLRERKNGVKLSSIMRASETENPKIVAGSLRLNSLVILVIKRRAALLRAVMGNLLLES